MNKSRPACSWLLSSLPRARAAAVFFLCASLLCASAPSAAVPQNADSYEVRKQHAIDVYRDNKLSEAMPLLETLHAENPKDFVVLGLLSFSVLANSATLSDPAARKRERARARALAVEAQAAGDSSNLTKMVLEIAPDGSEAPFSDKAPVEQAMREGEAAFAKGDFDAAVAAYSRALAFDPHLYEAALFLGDVAYKRKDHGAAANWFSRAIEIDPNREAAHRYWGDDLVSQDRLDDARDKFVEAVVAEPYNRRSWMGLTQWAPRRKLMVASPDINPPGKVESKDDSHINITIDPSSLDNKARKDGTSCWFIYSLNRAAWHGDRFKKEFPSETSYRHSMPEEVESLRLVVDQVKEGLKKREIRNLDSALSLLVKLSDAGLLEPYVLISRADEGISEDYPAYRDTHRDLVRRYINEWLIHPQP